MSIHRTFRRLLLSALAFCSGLAAAQSFCVYDPLGAGGDYYSLAKDYQLAARRLGVNLDLSVYTDDGKLDTAFRAGQCDMASMLGMRARQYNLFTGTLDAPSVIENYGQVRDVMTLLASPKMAHYMVSGAYEVVGLVPLGAAYAIVNDRSINSLGRANGKRVAVLGWDKTQPMMARAFGAAPVGVDITQLGQVFKAGDVDVVVSPLQVYKAFELDKAVGHSGGIVRRPLFQLSMQLVARADHFPAGFGQSSREYMSRQTDHALGIVHNQEAAMDNRVWIFAASSEVSQWNATMRLFLDRMASTGYFDRHMLGLLKQVRCQDGTGDKADCAGVDSVALR